MKTLLSLLFSVVFLASCSRSVQYSQMTWPNHDPLLYNVTLTRTCGGVDKTYDVHGLDGALNVIGKDGWRVVSSQVEAHGTKYLLERRGSGERVSWRALPRRMAR